MWRGRRWTRRQRCRHRGRTRRRCSTSGANCRFGLRGWPLADLQLCWHLVTSPCTPRKSPKPPPSTWPEWLPEFLLPLKIHTLASRWSNPSILFTYFMDVAWIFCCFNFFCIFVFLLDCFKHPMFLHFAWSNDHGPVSVFFIWLTRMFGTKFLFMLSCPT